MELLLQRDDETPERTIGKLFVDSVFESFTLEPPVRSGPKVLGDTAVPPGRYRVLITPSARFGRMLPLITGVPNFAGVRIHSGNVVSDTAGCVLVGQSRAHDSIASSRLALAALQPKIAAALAHSDDVWMTVRNLETT